MTVFRLVLAAAVAAGALMAADSVRAQTVIEEWNSAKAPPPPEVKAVTVDPKKTALLVMDFNKNGCTPERRARCVAALPKVQKILNEARAKGMLVIHTLSGTTKPPDIVTELTPKNGERAFNAPIDKFYNNDLEKTFKDRGIDTVILTGTSSNGAVLFTAGGAAVRGFKVIVPVDGMPGDGVYQEQFAAWNIANGPTVREKSTLTKIDMISFK
ncbi:MAG TPA: isochorismatase family cysteine hydrolase [Alphaproteobacteria bacterium]|nr:isochorismatase family cysteine hydrolase [Alphaproteobacteria bacterium]